MFTMKHLTNLATPKNISSFWSFGSLSGLCLTTQIITGFFLAMFFSGDITTAFDSAIHISRDVNYGWMIRNIHANGASMFFICLYIHIGRGIYYSSFKMKETWLVGVTIFFLTIITAFLGYVLPWGQMSYWAATVITNLISAVPYIGNMVVMWLWGGFSIGNATLTRFYAIHYILPLAMAMLSLIHIFYLHQTGSNNPLGISSKTEIMKFHPYFSIKDMVGVLLIWMALGTITLFNPSLFIDPENFIPANPLITPTHIQPEWYLLPMYTILRSIPNKLGGVLALISSIAILYLFPLKSPKVPSPTMKMTFWIIVFTFTILMYIGAKPVEAPFEKTGQFFTLTYFTLMIIL